MTIGEFTRGSEGSTELDCRPVKVADAAAGVSHPTSSGLILWSVELSNFGQSFQGQVETIHSTGSSQVPRLADACIKAQHHSRFNSSMIYSFSTNLLPAM